MVVRTSAKSLGVRELYTSLGISKVEGLGFGAQGSCCRVSLSGLGFVLRVWGLGSTWLSLFMCIGV